MVVCLSGPEALVTCPGFILPLRHGTSGAGPLESDPGVLFQLLNLLSL